MIRDEVRPYFLDVGDHATPINEAPDTMREMLTATMDVTFALVGIAQNDVFKKISGSVLLLTAPMMIASWCGMNFHDLPELDMPFAYPVTATITMVICIILYNLLRRANWLRSADAGLPCADCCC